MWPPSLIHRETGQHDQVASDIISDKSRSFWRTKSYGVFNSMVKGSQFEYDSRHLRYKIHVAPLADNRTFLAANKRSMVTTRELKIALVWKEQHNWMQR